MSCYKNYIVRDRLLKEYMQLALYDSASTMMKSCVALPLFLALMALSPSQIYGFSTRGLLRSATDFLSSSIGEGISFNSLPASGIMNCSIPGTEYPLLNGCNGWYICVDNNLAYPFSCPSGKCYNAKTQTCNGAHDSWFQCKTTQDFGKFVPWPQNLKIYGLCVAPDIVTNMNMCPGTLVFNSRKGECSEKAY